MEILQVFNNIISDICAKYNISDENKKSRLHKILYDVLNKCESQMIKSGLLYFNLEPTIISGNKYEFIDTNNPWHYFVINYVLKRDTCFNPLNIFDHNQLWSLLNYPLYFNLLVLKSDKDFIAKVLYRYLNNGNVHSIVMLSVKTNEKYNEMFHNIIEYFVSYLSVKYNTDFKVFFNLYNNLNTKCNLMKIYGLTSNLERKYNIIIDDISIILTDKYVVNLIDVLKSGFDKLDNGLLLPYRCINCNSDLNTCIDDNGIVCGNNPYTILCYDCVNYFVNQENIYV